MTQILTSDEWVLRDPFAPPVTERVVVREVPQCVDCKRAIASVVCVLCRAQWCNACDVLAVIPGSLSPPDAKCRLESTCELAVCFGCFSLFKSSHAPTGLRDGAAFAARHPDTGLLVPRLRLLDKVPRFVPPLSICGSTASEEVQQYSHAQKGLVGIASPKVSLRRSSVDH
jgi:hypothetical protein